MVLHPPSTTVESVVIRQPMNDHGTVTVELEHTNETRHLVEYASDRIESVLRSLPAGTRIPVEMTRVGSRSNVWRVSAIPTVTVETPASRTRGHPKSS